MAQLEKPAPFVASLAFLSLAGIWLGMLLGVSFLATPAKFLAPSLTLPAALDVGRHTFFLFDRVEWGFSAALLLLAAFGRASGGRAVTALAVAVTIVAVQAVWLLPLLNARLDVILAGGVPPPSPDHLLYIGLEAAKALALVWALVATARQLCAWRAQPIRPPAPQAHRDAIRLV